MTLLYTMQAKLEYGDDIEVKQYQEIAFTTFADVLKLNSISDITNLITEQANIVIHTLKKTPFAPRFIIWLHLLTQRIGKHLRILK